MFDGTSRRGRPRRAAAVPLAGLVAGLLAAAALPVASPAAARAEAVHRAGPPVPALHWRPCDGGFQCATARVPLDYRQPRGKLISIAVIRHRRQRFSAQGRAPARPAVRHPRSGER